MTITQFLHCFLDPRGRASRKGFLVSVAFAILVETIGASLIWLAGVNPGSAAIVTLKVLFVWVSLVAVAKRLRDLGQSLWLVPGAVALQLLWVRILVVAMYVSFGPERLNPDTDIYFAMLIGCTIPIVAAALWLQISEGEASANRHGAPPRGLGFSDPESASSSSSMALGS
ncbi:MAG: DUF805 domain-containing protein [Beijerinckiaceae bacterium]